MHLPDLDDKVAAAAIAAAGTVIGALIQLRVAWRKEVSERARGVPVTKKSRRGPVLAVGVLLIAAAAGGFALSQYLVTQADRAAEAARGELQTQLRQISATAERLERASLHDHGPAGREAGGRAGAEAVTVAASVGPCRARVAAAAADVPAPCTEQDALRVTLCASVPSAAIVTDTAVYARPDDSKLPWTESRAVPGQDVGRAHFPDKPVERVDTDQTKQVCTAFASWDGDQAYGARLVVKYALAPAAGEFSNAALLPTSGVAQ